jgi:hypothetical protein
MKNAFSRISDEQPTNTCPCDSPHYNEIGMKASGQFRNNSARIALA